MVKVRHRNSNWKMVKQTAKKNGTCELLWRSGATSQSCKVTGAIRNVHDHLESVRTRPAVVNVLRPVEFKLIPQPWILNTWHHDAIPAASLVTWDFLAIYGRLFDCVPVWILTSDLHHRTQQKKKKPTISFWSAVFLQHNIKFGLFRASAFSC